MITQHRRSLLFLILLISLGILAFWSGYRIGKVDGQRDTFKKIEKRLEERSADIQTISLASQSQCFYLVSLKGEKAVLLTLLESGNCDLKNDGHFINWFLYTYRSTDKTWFSKFMESNDLHEMGPYDSDTEAVNFRGQVVEHEEGKGNKVCIDSTTYY